MNPLSVKRNDYHKNKKNSTVYTPMGVAKFLFDIIYNSRRHNVTQHPWVNTVFDPAIGSGRLTDPWYEAGCRVYGCDTKQIDWVQAFSIKYGKFEDIKEHPPVDLVLCNPPFNGAPGKQLYPELFLKHIFELFGVKIPVVLFVPMGCRLNQRCKSKRFRWLRDCGAEITSIVSLPLDIFPDTEFHAEILIFNVKGLDAHYFLPESCFEQATTD